MARLEGKVILITGGARGMGETGVRRLAAEGAKVVFTDISEEAGKKLESEFSENVSFFKQDVSNEQDWKDVIQHTEDTFGPLDVLVNNAGIDLPAEEIEKVDIASYQKVIDVNQLSVFLGMKHATTSMRKNGGGSIVNISSLAGIIGAPQKIAYTASKFAVRGMTKAAALELGQYGIRINSVHPGFIKTAMTEGLVTPELEASFPLRRAGEPDEVTNIVVWLASDESSYSTGAEYVIDGGLGAQ